ncbi:MAG: esterase/lipase [Rhodothermales bacterium]|jgi:esterase/lipase
MNRFGISSAEFALGILERLLKARIHVSGTEHIDDRPTMFVINHFTRAETLLLPYIIHKHTGQYVRSLADDGLFQGRLGDYLRGLGVMSTREPNRDEHIIGDLMCGRDNWLIYPEGGMIKSKKIFRHGKLCVSTPNRAGPPRTGAAMLALKSQVYKRRFMSALGDGDEETLVRLAATFDVTDAADLADDPTVVVPVTISYFPLRPGQNVIKKLVKKFFKQVPERLEEELEIEGNLFLRSTDIDIHFSAPIPVDSYLKRFYLVNKIVPFWQSIEENNLVLKMQAMKLTTDFMGKIYGNTRVNLDHLFCTALRGSKSQVISDAHLRRALFLSAQSLRDGGHRRHPSIGHDMINLLVDEPYPAYDDIRNLATDVGVTDSKHDTLRIDKLRLNMMGMFHSIRVNNPLVVIANELEPLRDVTRQVKLRVNDSEATSRRRVAVAIAKRDHELFEQDYRFFSNAQSKPRDIGRPYLLKAPGAKTGIVLSHGLLSAPAETRELAIALHAAGYTVYGVRLRGHGTSPENLRISNWQEWYRSYLRGYAVVRQHCDDVVFGGFSTGGLVALRAAAGREAAVSRCFVINPPIRLKDIKARLAPALHYCNSFFDACHLDAAAVRFVENDPENPDTNYARVPIRALHQLGQLMEDTRELLPKVVLPTQIICGVQDPTVNPVSSEIILGALGSADKSLIRVDCDRHVIIRGPSASEVAKHILGFLHEPSPAEEPVANSAIAPATSVALGIA